jgi:rhodanese-related sulfurtransferase
MAAKLHPGLAEDAMTPEPVTASAAKAMLDAGEPIAFVDARNPAAWGSSREKLPAALRIPVDEVNAHLAELPRGSLPITYCT